MYILYKFNQTQRRNDRKELCVLIIDALLDLYRGLLEPRDRLRARDVHLERLAGRKLGRLELEVRDSELQYIQSARALCTSIWRHTLGLLVSPT